MAGQRAGGRSDTFDHLEQIPLTDISKPLKIRTSYNALINAQNETQLVPPQELTDIVAKEIAPQIPQADCQLLITSDKSPAANRSRFESELDPI